MQGYLSTLLSKTVTENFRFKRQENKHKQEKQNSERLVTLRSQIIKLNK